MVSTIIMFISTSKDAGPIHELSHEYYPVFRCVFLIAYFFLLYGISIFIWKRSKIDFDRVLRVSYAHTYQVSDVHIINSVGVYRMCIKTS